MKKTWHILMGLVAGGVLVMSTIASAQIDHRVNQGNSVTGGRALDQNPGVGSSGFNLTRPGMTDMSNPGAYSNAIISGNVTGLAGFKGNSPIAPANAFRDSLPSARLSGFQSRSVGIDDVSAGRALQSTYFFGQPETISDLGYIRRGLNQPGSSTLATPYVPPSQNFTTHTQSATLRDNLRPPQDLRINITTPDLKPSITQRDFGVAAPSRPVIETPYRSAMTSSIFGTPLPPSSSTGASSGLPPLDRRFPLDEELPIGSRTVTDVPADRRVDPLTSISTTETGLAGRTDQPPGESQIGPTGSAGAVPVPGDGGMLAGQFSTEMPSNLGDDRFADLYNAVGVAQTMGVDRIGFDVAAPPPSEAPAEGTANRSGIPQSLMRKPSEGLTQLATAAKWASNVIDDPIRSFTGMYESRLNEYMRLGEEDLRAGRYYGAANHFELASAIDPLNPLPLMARGHALAAAGDYRSAVRFLVLGIQRFPQIAAFRIDLPAMIAQPDLFDIRRADLEDKLARGENPELRFLLGYLELYSGLPEEGLKNLLAAAQASPPDSIIGMFADLVTGQRELPPLRK